MPVLFVPRTPESRLIMSLKNLEEKYSEETGYRIKLQEKTGISLAAQLTTADPFSGTYCKQKYNGGRKI